MIRSSFPVLSRRINWLGFTAEIIDIWRQTYDLQECIIFSSFSEAVTFKFKVQICSLSKNYAIKDISSQINNSAHGIWRRIQAIPFNRTFTAEQQDKDLGIKLTAELPGILNWAIKGCLDWQEQGLNPPQVVLDQVSAYKTEMDSIAQFVEQECSLEADTKYSASKLYEAYRQYCQAIGRKPQSTNAFKKALEKLPNVYQHRTASGMQWHGIQPVIHL